MPGLRFTKQKKKSRKGSGGREISSEVSKFKVRPWIVTSAHVRGMLSADERAGERMLMGVGSLLSVYLSVGRCEGGSQEPEKMGASLENTTGQEVASWKSGSIRLKEVERSLRQV